MLKPGSPEWSEYTQLEPLMSRATSVGHWGVHVAGLLYRQSADLIENTWHRCDTGVTPGPAAPPGLHCAFLQFFEACIRPPHTCSDWLNKTPSEPRFLKFHSRGQKWLLLSLPVRSSDKKYCQRRSKNCIAWLKELSDSQAIKKPEQHKDRDV